MRKCTHIRMIAFITVLCCCLPEIGRADDSLSAKAGSLIERARQGAVIAQVKAALMDRKDVRSRYIRVQYDGRTMQLAGFVRDEKQGREVAAIAQRQQEDAVLETHWTYEKQLEDRDPYRTRVREQAGDADTWVRVRASLFSPSARGALENADLQAVDIRHGHVRVFLIVDAAPVTRNLAPYIKTIEGVKSFSMHVCRTLED